ncbi:MAG TPA: ROK family protein [Oscillatoriaceae cyanobacterium]
MSPLALGADIGGTKILTALVNEAGHVERSWRTLTGAARGGEAVMAALEEAIAAALAEIGDVPLVGIGVSAAGQVDHARGRIAYASPNIPGWSGMPVRDRLAARFGLPVVVDNDGNAAAYGEWWAGSGRDLDALVMITVGTGIGGGIVQDGRVLRGARWRGGEVGHMILIADGLRCNCGQPGCWEVYASGTAIARMAREARPDWAPESPAVFEAAAGGDAIANAVLDDAARYLALGLVSLSSVLDPPLFLLGGGVASQPSYLPRVLSALEDPAVSGDRGFDPARLALASLGNAAGAIGAAGEVFRAQGHLKDPRRA